MKTEPSKEHDWLRKLAGEWTWEGDCDMGPGQPRSKTTGSESVRSLGGLWIVAEGQMTMPDGGAGTSVMTLGYDPATKRYMGTWVGSMMTHLWIYDGEMDAAKKTLTLNAQGPSMSGDGGMAKYQDIISVKSKDRRTLTARVRRDDGTWHEFMKTEYRRKT